MNRLKAEITKVQKNGSVAFVKLDAKGGEFSALVLDFSAQIKEGAKCHLLFKENEVMVCDKSCAKLSARNKFVSKITSIEEDAIFARVEFDFEGKTITSLITKEAKNDLSLKVGAEFMWFVKSNEVMLEF